MSCAAEVTAAITSWLESGGSSAGSAPQRESSELVAWAWVGKERQLPEQKSLRDWCLVTLETAGTGE